MKSRRSGIARITTNNIFSSGIFLIALSSIFFGGGSHVNAATPSFLTNYQLYDRGEDLRSLQELFNAQGFVVAQSGPGSIGNETPLFGMCTYRALTDFQSAHGLPATGYFGPLARSFINSGTPTPASQVSLRGRRHFLHPRGDRHQGGGIQFRARLRLFPADPLRAKKQFPSSDSCRCVT